ncbi:MAG: hypothetical protein RI900_1168, partial [Actinomycetota bacterium]
MKLDRVWLPKQNPVKTKAGKRWQVRWRFDIVGTGHFKERRRTDFTHREGALEFKRVVEKAAFGVDGWCFDLEGDPVQCTALAASVFACVSDYIESRWSIDWQDGQRAKVIGRLRLFVIHTLIRPVDSTKLMAAYEEQRR